MKELRVIADVERCIGSGTCAFLAPHAFDVGVDGRVVVAGPIAADDHAALEAIDGCPTSALSTKEAP